ncbi:MAG: hypothetical protein Q7R95_10830 [bacterium]|nr:hypothetical protein [bacterium]
MCFTKPLIIKKVMKNEVLLENGIKAFYENGVKLQKGDMVLVYGNLIINKIKND